MKKERGMPLPFRGLKTILVFSILSTFRSSLSLTSLLPGRTLFGIPPDFFALCYLLVLEKKAGAAGGISGRILF